MVPMSQLFPSQIVPIYHLDSADWRTGAGLTFSWDLEHQVGIGLKLDATKTISDSELELTYFPGSRRFKVQANQLLRFSYGYAGLRISFDEVLGEWSFQAFGGPGWKDYFALQGGAQVTVKQGLSRLSFLVGGEIGLGWVCQEQLFFVVTPSFSKAAPTETMLEDSFGLGGFMWTKKVIPGGPRIKLIEKYYLDVIGLGLVGNEYPGKTEVQPSGALVDLTKMGLFFMDFQKYPWAGLSEWAGKGPSWHQTRNQFQTRAPKNLSAATTAAGQGDGFIFSRNSFFHGGKIDYTRPAEDGIGGEQYIYEQGTGEFDANRLTAGTYDFVDPADHSGTVQFFRVMGHTFLDVLPYLIYGN